MFGLVEVIVDFNSIEVVADPLSSISSAVNSLLDFRVTLNSITLEVVGELVRTAKDFVPSTGA